MAMTGFFCQDKYLDQTKKLTDEELGRLFRACMLYHRDGVESELNERESMAFDFIRDDIDSAEQSYTKKCEQNRRNRAGGNEQPSTVNNDRQQPSTTVPNINKDNIKEKDIKNNTKNISRRFTPPSIEDVTNYCRERKNSVNPERFIDFYSSKGWKVGNQPMKDWKAAVRTWEQRAREPTRILPAQDFEQRDYSGVNEEMMDDLAKEMAEFKRGAG